VQLLAGTLDVPLGERNALLISAGYAPVYGQRPLGAPELEPVRRALQFIMRQQEPYPALVLDGRWNIVMQNGASRRVFELFRGPAHGDGPINVMRTVFHPNGLRPFVENWEEVAECLMHAMHREVAATGSDGIIRLRDELLAYPDVPSRWRAPDALAPMAPLVSMRLRNGDLSLAFFSTMTLLGTPRDVTLEQLKIECFFPADTATEQFAAACSPRARSRVRSQRGRSAQRNTATETPSTQRARRKRFGGRRGAADAAQPAEQAGPPNLPARLIVTLHARNFCVLCVSVAKLFSVFSVPSVSGARLPLA